MTIQVLPHSQMARSRGLLSLGTRRGSEAPVTDGARPEGDSTPVYCFCFPTAVFHGSTHEIERRIYSCLFSSVVSCLVTRVQFVINNNYLYNTK